MTKNFVAHRLVIDYSLIIGNNQWLINWLPIDYLLITHWFHWCHWCHRLVMSGQTGWDKQLFGSKWIKGKHCAKFSYCCSTWLLNVLSCINITSSIIACTCIVKVRDCYLQFWINGINKTMHLFIWLVQWTF